MPTGLGGEQLWISPTNRYGVSSFNDLSDASRTTYITNGTSIVSDTIEGGSHAIQFNGTSDTTSWLVNPYAQTGTFSWSAWFNSDTLSGTQSICGGNSWSTFNGGFLFTSGGVVKFVLNKGVNGQSSVGLVGTTSLSTNTWYHVCVKGDGTNAYLYLNGSLEVSGAFNGFGTPWQKHFRIGTAGAGAGDSAFGTNTHFFDGKIDDVRVYSRGLNQSEITHLATARGVEGNPFKGLGDEQLWLCPSLQDSAKDLSNSNNHGTYNGGMGTISDSSKGGSRCYSFDGVDDYISVPSSSSLSFVDANGDTACSFSMWAELASYSNNVNSRGIALLSKGSTLSTSSADSEYMMNCLDGKPRLTLYPQASNGSKYLDSVSTNVEVPVSTWKHITFTYSGCEVTGCIQIFVDGVLVSATDSSNVYTGMFAGAGNFEIGTTLRVAFSRWLYGKMDDVRVFNRVLTQSEITHLASSRGVQGHPTIKGLGDEKLWLCPSFHGSANDISGNAKDGTLSGGAAIVSDTGSGGTKSFESYTTSTDSVDIPSGVLSDNSDVSLSVWVKNKQTSAGSRVRNIVRTTNDDLFIYANQTRYRGGAGGVLVQDTLASLNTTGYYHYALNYTQATGTVELFRNGVSIGTTSGAAAITVSGAMDLLQNSVGFVDDVRAYNRVLTPEEIAHLAKSRGVLGSAYNLNGTRHPLTSIYHVIR